MTEFGRCYTFLVACRVTELLCLLIVKVLLKLLIASFLDEKIFECRIGRGKKKKKKSPCKLKKFAERKQLSHVSLISQRSHLRWDC